MITIKSTNFMIKIIKRRFKEIGNFPNNPFLPVLIYKGAFDWDEKNLEDSIAELFRRNSWYRVWVNGIYDFHHYHSNNHEVLGIASGECVVVIGGDRGKVFEIKKGDAIILPAGTSHKKIECSKDFSCVGAYSINVGYDMRYGDQKEKEIAKKKILSVVLPKTDPVFGRDGPLLMYWKNLKKNLYVARHSDVE